MIDNIRDGLAYGGCVIGITADTLTFIFKVMEKASLQHAFVVVTLVGVFSMMTAFTIRLIQLARGDY